MSRSSWFSTDDSVAWGERFVLLYSPIWMIAVGAVQLTGVLDGWGDPAYLGFGVLVAAPLVVVPWLWPGVADRERPLYQRYWVQLNVWVGILNFVGNYLGTHYFFQALGMEYRFPTEWTLEATVAGSERGRVPIFLYLLTQAYFMTYHVAMCAIYRRICSLFSLGRLGKTTAVLVIAYVVAFAETFAMANPLLDKYFWYADRDWMLRVGSTAYAMYFVVSLPMVLNLAENGRNWTLRRVALDGLGASMMVMLLLELWTQLVVGPGFG